MPALTFYTNGIRRIDSGPAHFPPPARARPAGPPASGVRPVSIPFDRLYILKTAYGLNPLNLLTPTGRLLRDDVRADSCPGDPRWRGAVTCRFAPRNPCATPSAAGVATVSTAPPAPGENGPVALGVVGTFMEWLANGSRDREAGDRHRLASQGLSPVVDLEESPPRRRPTVPADLRTLVRTMSRDNPLWGAPRIHGELLKLGRDVSQATVAKYMARPPMPPLAVVAHVPDEPSPADCGSGFLRRPYRHLPTVVRAGHPRARAPSDRSRGGH